MSRAADCLEYQRGRRNSVTTLLHLLTYRICAITDGGECGYSCRVLFQSNIYGLTLVHIGGNLHRQGLVLLNGARSAHVIVT